MDAMWASSFKGMLLVAASAGALIGSAATAQPAGTLGQETDQPGQPGPAGPAGQATQPGTAVPAAQAASSGEEPAADGLADIVVTAERRTANVQRTAASVSVRTGDQLRKEGKFQLRDILENVPAFSGGAAIAPGLTAGGGTDTIGAGLTIRGIQSNVGGSGSNTSSPAAVAVYVDDVYEGVGGSYDLDRVEALRGPQGTLYGRSATAGVVALHSRDPNLSEFEGFGLAEFGNYALRHFSAALDAPVIEDKLGVRVSGDYYHRDGFDTENGLGRAVSKNARVKILAKPTETLSILVGGAVQYNEDATGGRTPVFDANRNKSYITSPVGSGKNHFRQVWANVQLDLGFATLTYIPAYRDWHQNALNTGNGPGFTITQTLRTPKDHFITNEARLTSNSDSTLKWQIGALDYYNTLTNYNAVNFNLPGFPLAFAADTRKKTRAFGVFGEATYPVTDLWRVTGGLRYDRTKVDIEEDYTSFTGLTLTLPTEEGRLRFTNWTYKLRTEYDLSARNMVYLSYSTGFSPGDASVTTDPVGQPFVLQLKDQTLKALEFGSKNRLLDNTLQANASVFYYRYSGYQNVGVDVDPSPNLAFATLVAPVRSYGGELELVYQPTPLDRLSLNLAYTKARFVNRTDFFKAFIARQNIFQVSPFTAAGSYSHRFDIAGGSSFTVTADGRYLSPQDGGSITALQLARGGLPLIRVHSVGIANINGTWTSADRRFSIGGYVRNITGNRYLLNSRADDTTGVVTGASIQLYQPRTFGGVATVNF